MDRPNTMRTKFTSESLKLEAEDNTATSLTKKQIKFHKESNEDMNDYNLQVEWD